MLANHPLTGNIQNQVCDSHWKIRFGRSGQRNAPKYAMRSTGMLTSTISPMRMAFESWSSGIEIDAVIMTKMFKEQSELNIAKGRVGSAIIKKRYSCVRSTCSIKGLKIANNASHIEVQRLLLIALTAASGARCTITVRAARGCELRRCFNGLRLVLQCAFIEMHILPMSKFTTLVAGQTLERRVRGMTRNVVATMPGTGGSSSRASGRIWSKSRYGRSWGTFTLLENRCELFVGNSWKKFITGRLLRTNFIRWGCSSGYRNTPRVLNISVAKNN